MTREEAIKIINEIYDGFEEQCANCKFFGNDNGESWEEGYTQCLRERICQNCKYYDDNYDNSGFCIHDWYHKFDYVKGDIIKVEKNFGCNRFERRRR